jgi:transcriptional regulator with XRE-family HTH domain
MGTHARGGAINSQSRYAKSLEHRLVAERLNTARLAKGWSIESLANRAGFSPLTVLNLLHCETDPQLSTISTLAQALGLSMRGLLTHKDSLFHELYSGLGDKEKGAIDILLAYGEASSPA